MQTDAINTTWAEQGWLMHLTLKQYIAVSAILLFLIIAWVFISLRNKSKDYQETSWKRNLISWGLRLVLLLISMGAMLWVLKIPSIEFLSLPVVVLFNAIPISPILIGSVILGFYLLVSTNHFFKILIIRFSEKFGIERDLGRQVRRFLMIFIIVAVGSVWIKLAGTFLMEFFSKELFEISNVKFTPWVLIYATIILYGISVALKILEVVYTKTARSKGISTGQSRMLFQIVKYAIWVVTIVLLLDSIGISINMLIASSAALLVGLGFGIQGLFNDMISGFVILFEGSIKVDDVVEIQSEVVGRVTEVGIRTSKIRTRDNITMIIPNHKFVSDNVINWSYEQSYARFSVDVGVAYGSDIRLVEKLLLACAEENPDVLKEPQPLVHFRDFGESSLDFRLIFWTNEVFWVERTKSRLRFAIDEKFREHNVSIPFPQRDIHFKSGFNKTDS